MQASNPASEKKKRRRTQQGPGLLRDMNDSDSSGDDGVVPSGNDGMCTV